MLRFNRTLDQHARYGTGGKLDDKLCRPANARSHHANQTMDSCACTDPSGNADG